jgi:CheY-like chemotaxis protein
MPWLASISRFLDCQIPDLDGYETIARIRASGERGRAITIVATTASSLAGDRERCLAAGMPDYVSKPLSPRDLGRVLDSMLAGRAASSLPAVQVIEKHR